MDAENWSVVGVTQPSDDFSLEGDKWSLWAVFHGVGIVASFTANVAFILTQSWANHTIASILQIMRSVDSFEFTVVLAKYAALNEETKSF